MCKCSWHQVAGVAGSVAAGVERIQLWIGKEVDPIPGPFGEFGNHFVHCPCPGQTTCSDFRQSFAQGCIDGLQHNRHDRIDA